MSPIASPTATFYRDLRLSAEAQKLAEDYQEPNALLPQLKHHRLYVDALRVMCHKLARREAIWWGSLCAWHIYRPRPPEADYAALRSAITWVQDPSEAKRRAAEEAGKVAGIRSPAGLLALAAFLSSGSITPPGVPEVTASPLLAAKTLATSVLLASLRVPPLEVTQCRIQFLSFAKDVTDGRSHWAL